MRVLLNHSKAKSLHKVFPDLVGVLFSPERTRYYEGIPFAIDNGAYGAYLKGEEFNVHLFESVCKKFAKKNPMFVVCPDKVGDRAATLKLWDKWCSFLLSLGLPPAFVFTDGMTHEDIPSLAKFVFIGGSTPFKEWAITQIPKIKQPVHVGRVNHHSRLWKSHNHGAASCDGTGWFRGDKKQENILMDYFKIKSAQQSTETASLFHIGAYCK